MKTKKKILFIFICLIIIMLYIFYVKQLKSNNFKNTIETNIEEEKEYLISVNYPKTDINKLDREIEDFVLSQVNQFKNKAKDSKYLIDRDELNIDYDYFTVNNRYINVTIKLSIYHNLDKKEEYYVQVYLFDKVKDEFYDILDILVNKNSLLDIINKNLIANNLSMIHNLGEANYSFNRNDLIIYLTNSKIITKKIPLKELELNIMIKSDTNIKLTSDVIKDNEKVIDPNLPVVALTFDDGPSKYTKNIIDILKNNNVNATFFVLGNKVENYKELISENIKNGNEIGNHSYNHKWLNRLSTNELLEQINMTQNILKETVNYTPTHFRPTYGSINNHIRKNTALEITLWTVDTKDWKIKNVDRIVERAIKNIKDGDIILMHDIYKRSGEALKKIIPKLKEQGYQFVTISELEEIKLIRSSY